MSDPERTGTDDAAALAELAATRTRIRAALATVIIGQEEVIEQLLLAVFVGGHCILEGVPGLAKTLLVDSLARTLDLGFRRIQFTPDLMPADITGTEVIQEDRATGGRSLRFLPGPVFANIVLADEINRTPPKTQAALLEAMQERQVSVGGTRHPLPRPFFVLATQNPIEQEGTYPLPEAQQDRFMFKLFVRYPSAEEEYRIAEATTATWDRVPELVARGEDLLRFQALVRRVPVPPHVIRYSLALARATRPREAEARPCVKDWVSWGAGPRAVQFLLLAAKARAALAGRPHPDNADIAAVAHPVLRHRIIVNFQAESEGVDADRVIDRLLAEIDPDADVAAPALAQAFHR